VRAEAPIRQWLAFVGWLACAAASGCGLHGAPGIAAPAAAPPPSAPERRAQPLQGLAYEFRIDEELALIKARVCFRGQPPPVLVPGMQIGAAHLRRAWVETVRGSRPLPADDAHIDLRGIGTATCIGYALELDAEHPSFGGPLVERRGNAIVTNTTLWLWRPPAFRDIPEMSARFALPADTQVSVPWQREGDHYRLDESAFAFYAFAAFGQFEIEHFEAGGARFEVAVLPGLPAATRALVVPWLTNAANMASQAFARFPRRRAQVIVVPSPASDEPVRFGTMNRGGGASAAMRLPVNAQLEPLLRDWVALHEFCHLLHPFVDRESAWLPEGLATYFQEVLRVRAGVQSEQATWQRLYERSQLGRVAEHSLAEESARMYTNMSFKMVYWAGASFALLADVEIRRQTRGRWSLDGVLAELGKTWAHQREAFSAAEVLDRMDQVIGAPVLHTLMTRWVEGPELPSLDALFESLGVQVAPDGVHYVAGAREAWIRDGIMHPAGTGDGAVASEATADRP
jgi:hypothetical protein